MKEIILTGSGGQGMILAGIILARAALRDDKFVTQTQVYGPEARGGATRSEVIIDDEPIDYPKVSSPDLVLAMNQESVDLFSAKLRPGGTLIVDSTFVHQVPDLDGQVLRAPITQLAKDRVGKAITANILALGFLNTCAGLVSPDALLEAVLRSAPRGSEEFNKKALLTGMECTGS